MSGDIQSKYVQSTAEYESSVEIYRRGGYEMRYDYDFRSPEHLSIWVALQQYVDHLERLELRRHHERIAHARSKGWPDEDYFGTDAHLYAAQHPHAGMYEDPYRLEDDLRALYEIAQQKPEAAFSRRYEVVRNITECLFKGADSRSPLEAELPAEFFQLNRLEEDAPAHTLAHLAPLADMVQIVMGELVSVPGAAKSWEMSRQGARQRILSRGLQTIEVGGKTYLARETVDREREVVRAPAVSASKLTAMHRSLSDALRMITGSRTSHSSRGVSTATHLLRLEGCENGPRVPIYIDSYWWASAISLAGSRGGWQMQQFRPGTTEEQKRRSFMLVSSYMDDGCHVRAEDALNFARALEIGLQHLETHDATDQSSFWVNLNQSGIPLGRDDRRHVIDKYRVLASFAATGAFQVRKTDYMLHGTFYGPSKFKPEDYDPLAD